MGPPENEVEKCKALVPLEMYQLREWKACVWQELEFCAWSAESTLGGPRRLRVHSLFPPHDHSCHLFCIGRQVDRYLSVTHRLPELSTHQILLGQIA